MISKSLFAYVSGNYFRHHLFDNPQALLVMQVALGKLDEARTLARAELAERSVDEPHLDDEDRAQLTKVKQLCLLLEADDRVGMAELLHAWEAATVRVNKLQHVWEPSPFPLETLI